MQTKSLIQSVGSGTLRGAGGVSRVNFSSGSGSAYENNKINYGARGSMFGKDNLNISIPNTTGTVIINGPLYKQTGM